MNDPSEVTDWRYDISHISWEGMTHQGYGWPVEPDSSGVVKVSYGQPDSSGVVKVSHGQPEEIPYVSVRRGRIVFGVAAPTTGDTPYPLQPKGNNMSNQPNQSVPVKDMFADVFDDVFDDDNADAMIAANGGDGEWETESPTMKVPRWSFPRFAGATDPGDMYLSRPGLNGEDTDVETVCAWLDAPRNVVGGVMLLGDPGVGKTALVEAVATHSERTLTTVVFTPDHTKDSLLLRFVGEGNGDKGPDGNPTPFTLGPLAHAMKYGHLFYGDEYWLLSDGVKPVTYAAADGRKILPEGNIDGSPLEIHDDFRFIVSTNPDVRGASLPEPIGSRFAATTLTVETSSDMLSDLGIDDSIIAVWNLLGANGMFRPQVRELRAANYWLSVGAVDQAASAFLPAHCPESQRAAIRNHVVSFLGGGLREDGRLIVS